MFIKPNTKGKKISIINNTNSEVKAYGELWGHSIAVLRPKHLDALKAGKIIVFNDGEYVTYLCFREE